jgi:hypothetical protein
MHIGKNKLLSYRGPNWRRIIPLKEAKKLKFKRIWLISSSWDRDGTLDENSEAVREWMQGHYKRVFEKWMDGILIGLYEGKEPRPKSKYLGKIQ